MPLLRPRIPTTRSGTPCHGRHLMSYDDEIPVVWWVFPRRRPLPSCHHDMPPTGGGTVETLGHHAVRTPPRGRYKTAYRPWCRAWLDGFVALPRFSLSTRVYWRGATVTMKRDVHDRLRLSSTELGEIFPECWARTRSTKPGSVLTFAVCVSPTGVETEPPQPDGASLPTTAPDRWRAPRTMRRRPSQFRCGQLTAGDGRSASRVSDRWWSCSRVVQWGASIDGRVHVDQPCCRSWMALGRAVYRRSVLDRCACFPW